MAKNAIIWRLTSEGQYPAIIKLQEKGLIKINSWFGDPWRCPFCTHDNYQIFRGILPDQQFTHYDTKIYNKVYSVLFKFIDMYSTRRYMSYDRSLHEFVHAFNRYFNFFYQLLMGKKTEVVLFEYIPHEGPDLILYEIAKCMDIKTIMFYQTIFPDKFFYLSDLEDFGWFNKNAIALKPEQLAIEEKFEKEIFYMKKKPLFRSLHKQDIERWKKSSRKIVQRIDQVNISKTLVTFFSKLRYKYAYRRNMSKYVVRSVDLEKKFVYFPMHLQPELTTHALGGIYVDQLLAVERLRNLLPPDWSIYVKENPKQTESMRPQTFFDRMRSIPNVELVSEDYDTYALLKNCIFLATITGTAGWEAISGGKKVLVFGEAWYKSLPGVFTYHKDINLDEIINYHIDHKELEKEFSLLMSKTAEGVVDPAYEVIVEKYDRDKNIEKLSRLLENII
jgi:hypothetical protein